MDNTLPPTEWSWRLQDGSLTPVETELAVAPEKSPNMITCECKQDGCSNFSCSCVKLGLVCTDMCVKCFGQICNNAKAVMLEVGNEEALQKVAGDADDATSDDE